MRWCLRRGETFHSLCVPSVFVFVLLEPHWLLVTFIGVSCDEALTGVSFLLHVFKQYFLEIGPMFSFIFLFA